MLKLKLNICTCNLKILYYNISEICFLGEIMENKKYKVIIDTDPGVDDSACLIYAFFNERIDIKLLTSVVGNVSVNLATRNLLHLTDILDINIPVAKGAKTAMYRVSETAEFIHQKDGLGGYVPPETAQHQYIHEDAVSALYNLLMNGDGDIIPVVLGPQTNIGWLLKNHPDVIPKIPKIVFMGGSPFGHPDFPNHISFNMSCDPEAFQIVLDSGIPLVMVPSAVGRKKAHLDEKYVYSLKEKGDIGKLLFYMYSMYWEPDFPDKRVATNDTCALFALTHPELFTAYPCSVSVNTTDAPGKTLVDFHDGGNVSLVMDCDRPKFLKLLDDELEKMKHIKLNVKFPKN